MSNSQPSQKTWKVVPSPGEGNLSGAAVISASNVWAVGSYSTGDNFFSPVIEHWNGTKWTVVSSSGSPDHYNALLGVVSIPGGNHLWAVGTDAIGDGPAYTYIEYYG